MSDASNPTPSPPPEPESERAPSLVRDKFLFRAQQVVGLIPPRGLGLARRAILYPLFAWLPLAAWAAWCHRLLSGPVSEPLLAHYAIHARLLVALPVLILGEGLAHALTRQLVPQFIVAGVVPESEVSRFQDVVRGILRLRDSPWPWLVMGLLIVAWLLVPESIHPFAEHHELAWAETLQHPAWKFGVYWFRFIARPMFQFALLTWAWRIVLLGLLLWRIARLNLFLAPLHPDRIGGLGFLERFPLIMAPFTFACSVVIAAHQAHEMIFHGARLASFQKQEVVFAVAMMFVALAPMIVFIPRLLRTRHAAILQYGPLVGEHSRLVQRRWIDHQPIGDPPLLAAPELGPTIDVASMYQGIEKMRALPFGKQALMFALLPIVLPFLLLFSLEIPVADLLGKAAKILF